MATKKPPQKPEGKLIEAALKRTGMSVRKAAEKAGISDTRWRQVVAGYQTPSRGNRLEVEGSAERVARMAHVVGVTPNELREAGRPDAAQALDAILQAPPVEAPARSQPPPTETTTPPSPATPPAPDAPAPDSVLGDPAEVEIWAVQHMAPVERADLIATHRVRRSTTELRAEVDQLRAEVDQLRAELAAAREDHQRRAS